MKLFKTTTGIVVEHDATYYIKQDNNWDGFINRKSLYQAVLNNLPSFQTCDKIDLDGIISPPIGGQELWAAGVTYKRSKEARMEESEKSGGSYFYDKIYDADRPELFFKGMAQRISGHNDVINIRGDSTWNVPEPELTLFISSSKTIEGCTIGNDMSSRSIEGENPLYLPQAKVYDKCAGLGPCILVLEKPLPMETEISLQIKRNEKIVFEESIAIDQIKRKFSDLVNYLFHSCSFPNGCFLMTGTGIVPPDSFTLAKEDIVNISIEGIGTLTNNVGEI